MTVEYITGPVEGLETEKLDAAFAGLDRSYKGKLYSLLLDIDRTHPLYEGQKSDVQAGKNGSPIQRFMDDVPNFAAGVQLAVQENDAQLIYNVMISPLKGHLKNGFPEDHFAAAQAMIDTYPDEAKKQAATVALQEYKLKLTDITRNIYAHFDPSIKRYEAPDANAVTSIDAQARLATVPQAGRGGPNS